MTGSELKTALEALGWSQARLSSNISMQPHTVGRWISDRKSRVPGPVAAYVRLALKAQTLWKDIDSGEL